jgi:hypothetical protein
MSMLRQPGGCARAHALVATALVVVMSSLALQSVNIPASAAGGMIELTVYSDLSACGSMAFSSPQLAIEGAMASVGGGSTSTGGTAPIAGADYKSVANSDSISLCLPGTSNLSSGSATFEFEVHAADQRGAPTVGYATVTCTYTNGLGLQCPPIVRFVVPPSNTA